MTLSKNPHASHPSHTQMQAKSQIRLFEHRLDGEKRQFGPPRLVPSIIHGSLCYILIKLPDFYIDPLKGFKDVRMAAGTRYFDK